MTGLRAGIRARSAYEKIVGSRDQCAGAGQYVCGTVQWGDRVV